MKSNKPLLAFTSKRTLRRKMPSGLSGWVTRLRTNYNSYQEWECASEIYGLVAKLGYKDAETAWEANPIVCGSVDPSAYARYKGK